MALPVKLDFSLRIHFELAWVEGDDLCSGPGDVVRQIRNPFDAGRAPAFAVRRAAIRAMEGLLVIEPPLTTRAELSEITKYLSVLACF